MRRITPIPQQYFRLVAESCASVWLRERSTICWE